MRYALPKFQEPVQLLILGFGILQVAVARLVQLELPSHRTIWLLFVLTWFMDATTADKFRQWMLTLVLLKEVADCT